MDTSVSKKHNASTFRSEVVYSLERGERFPPKVVHICNTTWWYNSADQDLNTHSRENLTFYMIYLLCLICRSLFISNLGRHKPSGFQNFRKTLLTSSSVTSVFFVSSFFSLYFVSSLADIFLSALCYTNTAFIFHHFAHQPHIRSVYRMFSFLTSFSFRIPRSRLLLIM